MTVISISVRVESKLHTAFLCFERGYNRLVGFEDAQYNNKLFFAAKSFNSDNKACVILNNKLSE